MKCIRIFGAEIRVASREEWGARDMEEDFSAFICNEIRSLHKSFGCPHGENSLRSCPPMMYPELLACMLHHQRALGIEDAERALREKDGA